MILHIGYIFFSFIETFSYFILALAAVRLVPQHYLKEISIVSFIVAFLSFFMREAVDLKQIFPIIVLIIFTAFQLLVVKAPFWWGLIIAFSTYVLFFIIQTGLLLILTNTVISLEKAQSASIDQFIGQTVTAIVIALPSLYLFNKGIGYSADFTKLRFSLDTVIGLPLCILLFAGFGYVFIQNDLVMAFLALSLLVCILIYFAVKKERAYDFKSGK